MKLYYKEIYLSDNLPSPGKTGHANGATSSNQFPNSGVGFFFTSNKFRPYP